MNLLELNVLVLAYMGDSIYEKYVREKLIRDGIGNVNDLQSKSIMYVSAKAQAKYIQEMIDNGMLEDFEKNIVKRARNNRSNSHPKNCDIITYKYATGLEALIGYLYLSGNNNRIDEIMNYILR
ncbi:MAG: ribonuclease III [Bacilli bacterium]|nr:ribonuclease III [Bacilli bacterium]